MSYQPQPLPVATRPRGRAGMVIGVLLIVAGLAGGAALIVLSGANKEETVKKFARAPVGCTTSLEFDRSGEFTLYIETKGSVPDGDGDCANDGVTYDRGDDDLPSVTLILVAGDESEVGLDGTDPATYDAGAYAGTAWRIANIDEPGTYRLTVTSNDSDFAIAVGGDPDGDSTMMLMGGVAAIAAGLVLGVLVLMLGRRRASPQPSAPAWQPTPSQWPQQPTVPGYHAPQPGYGVPAPPQGQGWGAPQPPRPQE